MAERVPSNQSRSLRDWFPGHYSPKNGELAQALSEATVALDANVLLGLYRVIPEVRAEQIDAFSRVGDRLWIPHRVGQEFHERRFNAIRDQANLFNSCLDDLAQMHKQGRAALERLREACGAEASIFAVPLKTLDGAVDQITNAVKTVSNSCDISIEAALRDDHILRAIDSLLKGRVGPPFESKELEGLKKRAQERFESKIPPGYSDSHKEPDRAIGDFLLWEQLISHAKQTPRPVMFISKDNKEDWVRRDRGARIGPRPELVEEMKSRAGRDFYLVRPNEFLALAKAHLGAQVSQGTIEAVAQDVTEHQSARESQRRSSADVSENADLLFKYLREIADTATGDAIARRLQNFQSRPSRNDTLFDINAHERHILRLLNRQDELRGIAQNDPQRAYASQQEFDEISKKIESHEAQLRASRRQLQFIDEFLKIFERPRRKPPTDVEP